MASITLKGNEIHTNGDLPAVGAKAPAFSLTSATLEDVGLDAFAGKKKVLSISPSLDTGICQIAAKTFNERVSGRANTAVLVITSDLPFAQKRFCTAEGLQNVTALSQMRNRSFAKDYGMLMTDGPMAGLLGRAVVVLDENDNVIHRELVPEIAQEPDYDAAFASLG